MAQIKNFYDLKVWQNAKKIVETVYKITDCFPKNEDYIHTTQLRRAAISITGNIAEGFGRYHYMENAHFLRIARGSTEEVMSHIMTALAVDLIDEETFVNIKNELSSIGKMINKMISITNTQNGKN